MRGPVLAVNAGSSSLRTALYAGDLTPLGQAVVPALAEPVLELTVGAGTTRQPLEGDPLRAALAAYAAAGLPEPAVVGHRFVHGGPTYDGPRELVGDVLDVLRGLIDWAPLHQSVALAGVAVCAQRLPSARQVASFDTAFHRTMPELAQRLPLPEHLWEQGVRRYGFHGLSYEHVVASVGAGRLGRAVVAHLGGGSSLCALVDGRSVDTTMGFTPSGGVPMATRSGDLDPGVLLHLLATRTLAQVTDLVEHESGLAGLSGGEPDMRALLLRQDAAARLAVASYCRHVAKAVGALVTVLGGLDTLVFTGGIGEHAEPVRREVVGRLGHLGVPDRVPVLVVAADEQLVIARQALAVTG